MTGAFVASNRLEAGLKVFPRRFELACSEAVVGDLRC